MISGDGWGLIFPDICLMVEEKNNELWDKNRYKPRKDAVAAVRLETGHDCLAAYLHRIKLHHTAECTICKNPGTTMDSDHLLHCTQLDSHLQEQRNLPTLYWAARNKMN